MEVIRAKTAGFCMGVALALKKLDALMAAKPQHRILTLGPIIHNPHVLQAYGAQGVLCADCVEQIRNGDRVLIRAHGIPRQEEEALRATGATVEDATCPKVKKAQLSIGKATADGSFLLLFGEGNHPEVRGLVSYASAGSFVFDTIDKLKRYPLKLDGHYILASQTTQDRILFDAIERYLLDKGYAITVLSTICDATRERQEEALSIASRVESMVVVGGRSSGNTRRLVTVAQSKGIPTWHVESVAELKIKEFSPMQSIGLTAGASTPKSLIDAVEKFLEKM